MYKKIFFSLAALLACIVKSDAQYFTVQADTVYCSAPDDLNNGAFSSSVGCDRPIKNITSNPINVQWEYFLDRNLLDIKNATTLPNTHPMQGCRLCSPMMGCISIYSDQNYSGNTGTINPNQTAYFEFSASIYHDTINQPFLHGIALQCNSQHDTLYYLTELKTAIPTSIANVGSTNNSVKVYPNPAIHQCTIESQNAFSEVMIFDMGGRIQSRLQFATSTKTQLNLSQLTKGNYFVILNHGGRFSQKMIQVQ